MPECRVADNRTQCTCPSEDCRRRGICCECMRAHFSKKSLPMCMRNLDWLQVVKA